MVKDRQGFAPSTELEATDVQETSISMEDIKVETVELCEYNDENPPLLPIGIFIKDEQGSDVRLREIKVRKGVNTGDFDYFLAKLDPQQGENAKKTVDTLKNFLGGGKVPGGTYHLGAIESIGGIEIKELAAKKGYASAADLISGMYMGDVATLMYAVRLKTAGKDLAVDRVCPVPNCKERCRSVQDLSELKIKTWENLYSQPSIRFNLVDGISNAKESITYFLVEPLKLHQLNLFIGGGRVADIELMKAMVFSIPESTNHKKGRPFTDDLYKFMTQTDINAFRQLATKIQPGPAAFVDVICSCGVEEFPHQLNWARTPREFLYQSKELLEVEE